MNKPRFSRCGKFFVYILECQDGTYYTGYTNDIEKRINEHNNSKRGARYTKYKRPVKLAWCKEYKYYKLAVQEENRIKNLRRWQKEKLIYGTYAKLNAAASRDEDEDVRFKPSKNLQISINI